MPLLPVSHRSGPKHGGSVPEVNRRDFVKYSATAATAVVAAGTGFPGLAAASGPAPSPAVDDLTQRFDLVIAGGEFSIPARTSAAFATSASLTGGSAPSGTQSRAI